MKTLERINKLVEKECLAKEHFAEFFFHHVLPVLIHAEKLAEEMGADKEIVRISALLHDIALIRGYKRKNHDYMGAEIANEILTEENYPAEKIYLICRSISDHSTGRDDLPEARCLYQADNMSQITEISYLLIISFVNSGSDFSKAMKMAREKVEESWGSLSEKAKQIVKEDYEIAKRTLVI